jgi:hypothetical protein
VGAHREHQQEKTNRTFKYDTSPLM